MSPEPATEPTTPLALAWAKAKEIASVPSKFWARLINDDDHAVEAQIIAFCILFIVSVYWLHTRQNPSTGWVACFSTMWGAIALNNVFKHRGGSS